MIFGTVDLLDSKKLSFLEYQQSEQFHFVQTQSCLKAPYKNTYAWILENPILFNEPVPYKHPMGAVIWVNLSNAIGQDVLLSISNI